MELLKIFNEEGVSLEKINTFKKRNSVRGVVIDNNNNIAILYSNKFKFYTLPGGGVEEGETTEEAIIRECKEETGCNVKIIGEVGKTIEVREKDKGTNEAHCFILKVLGEKGNPEFIGDEIECDFSIKWYPLEKAISVKDMITRDDLYHQYMEDRDIIFLNKAKFLLSNNS